MIRLGILGCADIAFRRFMPAAQKIDGLKVVAVAAQHDRSRLEPFCRAYGLEGMESYDAILQRDDIDAVYVPLPPALHARWAGAALTRGKHVLVEKPSAVTPEDSAALVRAAQERGLALHENYMFRYHSQLAAITELIREGAVGEVRLFEARFGFPRRAQNDFRYNAALGGGALLDAGGYPLKLALLLLGETASVKAAQLGYTDDAEVDMFGSAMLTNGRGEVCQIAFGMDCAYQCSLEAWGSRGRLYTDRIFTAPDGFCPTVTIDTPEGTRRIELDADSHFRHSIEAFLAQIGDPAARAASYRDILAQAKLVADVRRLGEAHR